jgi:diguanylate cyclase (GGDEF)-like protein
MQGKVIVVDSCTHTKKIIKNCLQKKFKVVFAQKSELFDLVHPTPHKGLKRTKTNQKISTILLATNLKNPADLEIVKILKSNFISFGIPIIFLLESFDIKNLLSVASKKGAAFDDFIKKPINPLELQAKLLINTHKHSTFLLNPLTKLPGNTHFYETVKDRLRYPIAIFYIDLDNFKAYNDKYGFNLGDKVITQTAKIIQQVLKKFGNPTDFVGHLGGDDFTIISTPQKADKIAQALCTTFDQKIKKYYNKTDLKNKKIKTKNRKGKMVNFPLLSLSVAVITNERKKLTCVAQISQIACELKRYAKTKPNGIQKSNFVKERRSK